MKYVVTFFWTIIFGQIVGYLGASLMGNAPDVNLSFFLSLLIALIVIITAKVALPKDSE